MKNGGGLIAIGLLVGLAWAWWYWPQGRTLLVLIGTIVVVCIAGVMASLALELAERLADRKEAVLKQIAQSADMQAAALKQITQSADRQTEALEQIANNTSGVIRVEIQKDEPAVWGPDDLVYEDDPPPEDRTE